jgi:hypothetical protein
MSHGPGLEARAGLEMPGYRGTMSRTCAVSTSITNMSFGQGLPARQGAAIRAPEQVAAGDEVRRRGGV